MNSQVSKEKKKHYLKWLSKHYRFKKRESLWILNYLYNHDVMLNRTHFVEYAYRTPRGLYLSTTDVKLPAFRFYKKGKQFNDPIQAFHEVRLNWSSELYIEINIPDAWQYPEYLSVLEDNPYARWNEMIPDVIAEEFEQKLDIQLLESRRLTLLSEIDTALLDERVDDFNTLSSKLQKINQKIGQLKGE